MSECPSYYRTANGCEFWQFYEEFVIPAIADEFNHAQHHALQSACEYLFRSGVKTPNPADDYRKAIRLIDRVFRISGDRGDDITEIESLVENVIGQVVFAKILKEAAEKPETVDLMEPIETLWGRVQA